MIQSMTGYAAASRELPWGALCLELRSVNHRYLDIQLRLPEELRAVEPALREQLAHRLARGKIECRVSFNAAAAAARAPQLNEELLHQLAALEARVRALLPEARGLDAADILRWPGMIAGQELPFEEIAGACRELLAQALEELTAARAREGQRLKQLMLERAAAMERVVAEVAPRIPQVVAAHQEKLAARLREAFGAADDERIRQEVALFAAKVDVDEEVSRIGAHVAEVRRVLEQGGAVGRKLDFLMQELNREANTLAAKSADFEVTRAALELKLLVEQLREQIQNIE